MRKTLLVAILAVATLPAGAEFHAARAAARCLTIVGDTAPSAAVGKKLTFGAQCCSAAVPAFGSDAWLVFGCVLALACGAFALRRSRHAWLALLLCAIGLA